MRVVESYGADVDIIPGRLVRASLGPRCGASGEMKSREVAMGRSRAEVAAEIAEQTSKVAFPDSRFGRDFSQFIPSFEGADIAAQGVMATSERQLAKRVFVTPDNAVSAVRQKLIQQGVDLVVPSYGLHRGFLEIAVEAIPTSAIAHAGWLDFIEYYGRSLALKALAVSGPIDLIVTGASAITLEGLRFGMGDFYLDIEWPILRALGLVTDRTPVIAVVHDAQLTDLAIESAPSNVTADLIVTPAYTLRPPVHARPTGLDWSIVPPHLIQTATLQEFRQYSSGAPDLPSH